MKMYLYLYILHRLPTSHVAYGTQMLTSAPYSQMSTLEQVALTSDTTKQDWMTTGKTLLQVLYTIRTSMFTTIVDAITITTTKYNICD